MQRVSISLCLNNAPTGTWTIVGRRSRRVLIKEETEGATPRTRDRTYRLSTENPPFDLCIFAVDRRRRRVGVVDEGDLASRDASRRFRTSRPSQLTPRSRKSPTSSRTSVPFSHYQTHEGLETSLHASDSGHDGVESFKTLMSSSEPRYTELRECFKPLGASGTEASS